MIKKIYNWIKKRIKQVLIGLGILGVVLAAGYGTPKKEMPEHQGRYVIDTEMNLNGVKYEKIRKKIDIRYKIAHDILSEAYYNRKPFIWGNKDYGILDKKTFDELQALIWMQYEILFDETNKKQNKKDQIPITEYESNLSNAKEKVKSMKNKGFDIKI